MQGQLGELSKVLGQASIKARFGRSRERMELIESWNGLGGKGC